MLQNSSLDPEFSVLLLSASLESHRLEHLCSNSAISVLLLYPAAMLADSHLNTSATRVVERPSKLAWAKAVQKSSDAETECLAEGGPAVKFIPGSAEQRGTDFKQALRGGAYYCRSARLSCLSKPLP